MHNDLFMRIVECVSGVFDYIWQHSDARGTLGFDLIKNCKIVYHMLAYDNPPCPRLDF